MATMSVNVGPCDDEAHLFLNGFEISRLGLGEVRRFERDLADGDYQFRLQVINSGGWAWRAKLLLLIDGVAIANVDEVGGTGAWNGEVYDKPFPFSIRGGRLIPVR